jgi:hypothetical protein
MHGGDTVFEARLGGVRPEQVPEYAPFELVFGEGSVWAAAERGAGGEPGGGPGHRRPPGDRGVGADVSCMRADVALGSMLSADDHDGHTISDTDSYGH